MDIPLAQLLGQLAVGRSQPGGPNALVPTMPPAALPQPMSQVGPQTAPQPMPQAPAGPYPNLPSPMTPPRFAPDGTPIPPTSSYPPLTGPPARPYTPTPLTSDALADALYGGGQPPAPLPSYLPPNVQDYIRTQPSYSEGQRMPSGRQDNEPPQLPNPTIDALRQQFRGSILRNAPTQVGPDQAKANMLRGFWGKPGFGGLTGGDDV
jgi:hypothetical protein